MIVATMVEAQVAVAVALAKAGVDVTMQNQTMFVTGGPGNAQWMVTFGDPEPVFAENEWQYETWMWITLANNEFIQGHTAEEFATNVAGKIVEMVLAG